MVRALPVRPEKVMSEPATVVDIREDESDTRRSHDIDPKRG